MEINTAPERWNCTAAVRARVRRDACAGSDRPLLVDPLYARTRTDDILPGSWSEARAEDAAPTSLLNGFFVNKNRDNSDIGRAPPRSEHNHSDFMRRRASTPNVQGDNFQCFHFERYKCGCHNCEAVA